MQDVGVDLGGFDVFVAEEFLDGADVVAGFEQVGGEAVTEGVTAGGFDDAAGFDGGMDGALEVGIVGMVTARDA